MATGEWVMIVPVSRDGVEMIFRPLSSPAEDKTRGNMNIKFTLAQRLKICQLLLLALIAIGQLSTSEAISIPPAGDKAVEFELHSGENKKIQIFQIDLKASSKVPSSSSPSGSINFTSSSGADAGPPAEESHDQYRDHLNDADTAKAYALVQRALRESPLIDG